MTNRRYGTVLRNAVLQSKLLRPGETLLVALSGGPDSMALLETVRGLAQQHRWRLHAAHLNHQLRGPASDKDEAFVHAWAKRHAIPLARSRMNVARYAKQHDLGLEAAARRLRYAFLEETARKIRADAIVLAHTADDQAETVLWRMLRGAVGGLAGIPPVRRLENTKVRIVRPFLSVSKKDILGFLQEQKIPYRMDASNKTLEFTRNRIRHRLIPYLTKHYNPSLAASLNAMAQSLAQQRDLIEGLTRKALARKILKETPDVERPVVHANIHALQKLHPALRAEILKRAYASAGGDMDALKNDHVKQLLALNGPVTSSKQWYAGGVWATREQNRIVFRREKKSEHALPPTPIKIPGTVFFSPQGRLKSRLIARRKKSLPWKKAAQKPGIHDEYFDWDALQAPLILRQRQSGDRYQPIGLMGTKKVKDMLMDRKIPFSQRNNHPVFQDATGKILWVAGLRIAEFCKIRPETKKILVLSLKMGWKKKAGRARI